MIFDTILNPLLKMDPFLAIVLISFILSIMITIIYKYMTDQELMKTLKADIKGAQKEMKAFKDNPEKMMKMQKQAMEKNMKYMMHSMKPTLITFIPIILVFGWLNSNFAYLPIQPDQEFDMVVTFNKNVYGDIEVIPPPINNSIILLEKENAKRIMSKELSFRFKAVEEGTYDVVYLVNNATEYRVSVMVDEENYIKPDNTKFEGRDIKKIDVGNPKKIVLNLFGWEVGWLGTYIIFSIVFSMLLRKILKLH